MTTTLILLHDDARFFAVAKPAGWETLSESDPAQCLTTRLRRESGCPTLSPCHRLDRDTTGVQLFAKTPESLRTAESAFRHRTTEKLYLALCLGVPRNPSGTIRRNLSEWTGGHKPVRVVKGGGGLPAETDYRVLCGAPLPSPSGESPSRQNALAASLLLFHPHQGRTHQIRVHAAAFGYPILGDDQYGDRPANLVLKHAAGLKRQALHAWRLSLPSESLRLEAPLPDDLSTALDTLHLRWRETLSELPAP